MTRSSDLLPRFSRGELWIHRVLALLIGVCIATAAVLYVGSLGALVGRRDLVATVHLVSGLLAPVPLLLGWLLSRAFRADVRRVSRFLPDDIGWLRSPDRRSGAIPSGKFNAGQKLNSAFVLGAVLVLLATGLMLHWFDLFSDELRTGATFVHDLVALAVVLLAAGHVRMAWLDPVARSGLRTGFVPREWARHEHALWVDGLERDGGPGPN
ncbi:MAG: cytochrome b/b6 domain-containing protein [Candidatus Nanopelagicales bacterium]